MTQRERRADNTLMLRAIIAGVARWEPFPELTNTGEVCVSGLRHSTVLQNGTPVLHEMLRVQLRRALEGKP